MMKLPLWIAICCCMPAASLCALAETMHVQTNEPVLFVDDSMVAKSAGVKRTFHSVTKHPANPLLKPDREWESQYCIYGSVMYDREAGLFKMWHYGGIVDAVGPYVMYATSKDGVQWNRPALGLFEVPNRKVENNIALASWKDFRFEMQTVLFEPEDDAKKRYKMLLSAHSSPWSARPNYYIWYSADGIHFNRGEQFGVEKPGYVDVGVLVRNPKTKRYRLYHRAEHHGRAVAYKESEDLKNWTPSQLIIHTDQQDPPGSELYKFSPFPYGNYWIGMLTYYNHNLDHGMLWPELAWSLDGIDWKRHREPFIPLGSSGEWDRFNNSVATQPLIVGDELWFYYSGRTMQHDANQGGDDRGPHWGAIGLAKLRLDGFVSLDASFDGGTVETRPFILPEGELFINATCDFGEVGIEVLDKNGQLLEGYKSTPLKGDGVFLPVGWTGGHKLTSLAGKTVALRFTLNNARLYSFRVGQGSGLQHLSWKTD